jgi:hypothetical protein
MDVEARFWELCDEATRLEKANWDASRLDEGVASDGRSYERPMVEIIELVERHPEHRDLFVRCFSEIVLWRRHAPFPLAGFCMRALRFPEIKELIHRDADEHKDTAYYADRMNYWSSIMHAYLDFVWEDASHWAYYSSRELVPEMVPALIQRLMLPDYQEQFNAAWALLSIGPPARSALPALNDLLVTATQEGSTNLVNAIKRAIDSIQHVGADPDEPSCGLFCQGTDDARGR